MRTQAERDEQTLDIVSTLLVGLLVWGAPVGILLALTSGLEVSDRTMGTVFAVAFGGFVATVVVRLWGRP